MNFDEFVKEMQENIKTYLPEWYENATVDEIGRASCRERV